MSTSKLFLDEEEIKDFVAETLGGDYLYSVGYEGREIGLCPFMTFYIYNTPAEFVELCERVVEVFSDFESNIIDEPFKLLTKGLDHLWLPPNDARLRQPLSPAIHEAKASDACIFIGATDMDSPTATAHWAFDAVVSDGIGHRYTRVKLTFRNSWYRRNRAKWLDFTKRCITKLRPDQCYSGFEVGNGGFNLLGAYECDVLERISADYFYGMDIDHPAPMSFHNFNREVGYVSEVTLGGGIRTPTWSFLLSPYWMSRLGRSESEVRAALADPRIEISKFEYEPNSIYPQGGTALWIRLGELDLHPVERGFPLLPVLANRLIRAIRCDHLQLLTLAPWDGDPNPRFDYQDSLRWMRRFDDDSDWPSAKQRNAQPSSGATLAHAPHLRAMPGESAPQTGWWISVAIDGELGRVHRHVGDPLPGPEFTSKGQVVWTFDADQSGS